MPRRVALTRREHLPNLSMSISGYTQTKKEHSFTLSRAHTSLSFLPHRSDVFVNSSSNTHRKDGKSQERLNVQQQDTHISAKNKQHAEYVCMHVYVLMCACTCFMHVRACAFMGPGMHVLAACMCASLCTWMSRTHACIRHTTRAHESAISYV